MCSIGRKLGREVDIVFANPCLSHNELLRTQTLAPIMDSGTTSLSSKRAYVVDSVEGLLKMEETQMKVHV